MGTVLLIGMLLLVAFAFGYGIRAFRDFHPDEYSDFDPWKLP